jgi:hypothetical protein
MHFLNRLSRWFGTRPQSLVAGMLVLCIVVASLGVPVALEPQRETSQPYPCMHHRCGCGSAAACWRGCCCMTHAQKLAWAKEHGVSPPDYALAQVEQEQEKGTGSCGSCADHHVCNSDTKSVAHSTLAEAKNSSGIGIGLILSEDFRRCHGLAAVWLMMGHALPPRMEPCIPRYQGEPVSWLAATSQSAESLILSLDTPPPRHS